jgi:hypothetical protein
MSGFDALMQSVRRVAASIDVLLAQQAQMSAMRQQSDRLHKLLRCAPTAQVLAADMASALGSAGRARAYLDEMRQELQRHLRRTGR